MAPEGLIVSLMQHIHKTWLIRGYFDFCKKKHLHKSAIGNVIGVEKFLDQVSIN